MVTPNDDNLHSELACVRDWFESDLGQQVVATEQAILDQLLTTYFGYHLLQVSPYPHAICGSSPIQNKMNLALIEGDSGVLRANPYHLPFEDDSLDVAVLHHALDFVDKPQELLREISRVVLPMGRLVMVGFNPFSLWGAWKLIARYGRRPPWNAAFIRPDRLMDWMNLLNFKIDRAQYCHYGLPLSRHGREVPDFSKGLSRNANLPVGGVYVIVAQKHVGTMTQIRPAWRRRENRAFGQLSVVRSASRDIISRRDTNDSPKD